MAHFNLESELSDVLKLDAPITKGPTPRWERKNTSDVSKLGASFSNDVPRSPFRGTNGNLLNKSMGSLNKSMGSLNKSMGSMNKSADSGKLDKSSGSAKTPATTPSGKAKKPSLSASGGIKKKTPRKTPNAGDRFIPNRATTQFELGYYKLTNNGKENDDTTTTPCKKEYQRIMSENLNGGDISAAKIIHYNANKPPIAPDGHLNNLRVVYTQTKTPASMRKTTIRHIPQQAERILDAPLIVDDYYLNLLDWSINNHVALALGPNVYLWNAASGEIQQLMSMDSSMDYVSSLSWMHDGTHLAIGTSIGEVQLWDVADAKRIRNMRGHAVRVSSLSWNSYIISSGSRSGRIHHHDVRAVEHHVASSLNHTQEICGLKWSLDGRILASGGNDNQLNLWSLAMGTKYANNNPVYSLTHHQAAVKALAWCPWQASVLASGGGTSDRCIRFWNVNNGSCMSTVDTKSQVCGLLWSNEYKEIISGHGFANNQLIVWKYPAMQKIAELNGHSSRILHMAMSPDGSCVASAAADETLRIWQCFIKDPAKKSANKSVAPKSVFKQCIR